MWSQRLQKRGRCITHLQKYAQRIAQSSKAKTKKKAADDDRPFDMYVNFQDNLKSILENTVIGYFGIFQNRF